MSHSYDNANRVIQITQGSSTVSFAYDAGSRRTSLTLPNGIVMSYSYDNASELAGIGYTNGSTNLGNLTYSYDLAGRRTNMGGSYAQTGLPQAISTTAYNANNQLTQWGTATPTYDNNGNMLSDGTNSFVWNARNQLSSMNSGLLSFQYEPYGRRSGKTVAGITTSYLYDGANIAQEISGGSPIANLLSGLYFYRARYYNPQLQRFVSEDPLHFGSNTVNFYEYAYDSPQDFIDPCGMQEIFLTTEETVTLDPIAEPDVVPKPLVTDPALPLPPSPAAPLPPPNWSGAGSPFSPPAPISGPLPGPGPAPSPSPSPQPKSPMAGRYGCSPQGKDPGDEPCKQLFLAEMAQCYARFTGEPLRACQRRAELNYERCRKGQEPLKPSNCWAMLEPRVGVKPGMLEGVAVA